MTEESKSENPTHVNPFNGVSDPNKAAEVAQTLWDKGAWNADGKPEETPEANEGPAEKESRPAWHDDYEAMERAEKFAEETRGQKGQQLHQAMLAGQQSLQQLRASFQQIPQHEWERLRAENPQAFQQIMADYQAREQQINQHLSTVQAHAQGLAREFLSAEKEKALKLVPEWRDPATFASAKQDMIDYARRAGFTEDELNNVVDHRHLVALYHASQAGKPPAPKPPGVKLTKPAPRASKPTNKAPPELSRARANFEGDPRDISAQSAYAQRLLDALEA